ncbi:MAG: alkaline phosphatase family protein [Flavobacteriales bacterium]|nr:alkaline phosphatase family protein [Flavobacteriales bacterium]NUQ14473.1 alkaline phosphatase family protein [Flavobacteriales bacterium]
MTTRLLLPLLLLTLPGAGTHAQTKGLPDAVPRVAVVRSPAWASPPKLVVGIVVDQMRADHLLRFWDNFGEGGFKRLVGQGACLRDAHYPYAQTNTGPGHASIYTGTTPSDHGIVANDMYFRARKALVNCVQDDAVTGVGGGGPRSRRSPVNLYASTLADELERRTEGRSRTIGVAMKDRGAILPIGRTGDAAYWFFGQADGAFGTSTWYMDSLPQWMRDFNARGLVQEHLRGTWAPLLPRARYHSALPDDNPYEQPLPGTTTPTLPVDLARAFANSNGDMEVLLRTPGSLAITTALALAAVEGEGLGQDAVPDLLAVSYSATDELGHEMGVRALELEDMYLRLDRELERLLQELDRRVGVGAYTLFLTADHAAVDVPAFLADRRASAGYVDAGALVDSVQARLTERYGPGRWVLRRVKEQLFLNDSLIQARGLEPMKVQRTAADAVRLFPGVAEAHATADLLRGSLPSERAAMVLRGLMPERSGDVCIVLRPGHLLSRGGAPQRGTDHGTPWTYDTHVPLLFFGKGIRPGEVLRRVPITDIAPTIAMLLGTALPDACSGQPVPEVLAP